MRRLILFRHAKAAGRARGQSDRDRPLEASGRQDAAACGQWLAAHDYAPDLVLVSPSARTVETWECAAPFLPPTRVERCEGIYDAEPEDIEASLAAAAPEALAILVIGHNPGLQDYAVALLDADETPQAQLEQVAAGFPTATLAVLRFETGAPVALEAVYNPRKSLPPPFLETWEDEAGAEG